MKKLLSVILAISLMLVSSSMVLATERPMTVDEARAYLENYYETRVNSAGKEYTVEYEFTSESDLNGLVQYIAENGLSAFNAALEASIREVVGNETSTQVRPQSVQPLTAFTTVSGNGKHNVSTEAYGLTNFDTLGDVEYIVQLGYQVTVKDGEFTNLTNISFDVINMSVGGSWGNTRFPSYYSGTSAGVTANFDVTKTVEASVGGYPLIIKTETDNEVFGFYTNIQ